MQTHHHAQRFDALVDYTQFFVIIMFPVHRVGYQLAYQTHACIVHPEQLPAGLLHEARVNVHSRNIFVPKPFLQAESVLVQTVNLCKFRP